MQKTIRLLVRCARPVARFLIPTIAASVVLMLATSAAAKDEKKTEEPASDAPPGFVGDTNSPGEFGESGYMSWGTNGGATLGHGDGVRANFIAGQRAGIGTGFGAVEGYYIMGMSPDFDLFLGGRIWMWYFGAAPGVRARFRIIGGPTDAFHLAIDAGAYVGFSFYPGIAFGIAGIGAIGVQFAGGATLDPGVAGSYFIKDNMEIFFGVFVPTSITGGPMFAVFVGFDARGGFVYTFKKVNLGVFAQVDIVPTLIFHDRVSTTPAFAFNGSGTAGIQWRF